MRICINHSGLSEEVIAEKLGPTPASITTAAEPSGFSCKTPEFRVNERGQLEGGDPEAMAAFNRIISARQAAEEQPSEVSAEVAAAGIAPEPCC